MKTFLLALGLVLSLLSSSASATNCTKINTQTVPHVHMDAVRRVWLRWVNDARRDRGLPALTLDPTLNATAGNWAFYSVKRGSIDHKRSIGAAYYDYKAIEQWFKNLGVTFKNIDGKTFTENIGWGVYKCSKQNCDKQLSDAIRSTFDFYMREEGTKSDAHFRSIVNPLYTKIGVGIGVDRKGKYYLAVHYAAKINEAPVLCSVR